MDQDNVKTTSSGVKSPKQPPKKWYGTAMYQKERDIVTNFVS